ncbi:MAG: type II secretion system secretin GspD [Proteobacteria bacterium]|nr:type II secretion system secretin GspD [Pseudomonadota bacterium]
MTTHPLQRFALSSLALALALTGAPLAAQDLPMPASKRHAPVTLNFVNADIEMVTRAIGAMLDRQILVDPRVRGQITLTNERAQPPQEAWRSYLASLRGLGFTVVDVGGLLKVVPEAEAKFQAGTVVIGTPSQRGDLVVTQIFRLNHENPNNLIPILRPMISANNVINANPATSSLIITDYADNLQRIAQVISALDQPVASDVEVITLEHALASDVAPLVQRLSDGGTGITVPGAAPGTGNATTIMIDPRSNSLIVRAANPTRMAAVRSLVSKLDRPVEGSGPAGRIWVVYLRNADAVKLAEVLRATLASGLAGGGAAGAGGPSPISTTPQRPAPQQPMGGVAGATASASGGTSAAATTPVSQSAGPSTGGQIQADPSSNSLIISAPEPVYRQLRQVIDQLDTRRAQIYVESLIVKVDAQRAAEMGIQWQGLLANNANTAGLIAGTNFGTQGDNILSLALSGAGGTTGSLQVPGNGLNLGLVQKIQGIYTLTGLARFLENTTGANVLSTPTLMALDNEEAKIVVGQNVPFVTGSYTNTGAAAGSTNPFQTIERKDVGLTLRVKSQVGEGGTVRMTIYQENSNVSGSAGNQGLITDKSAVETTVVVNDGQMLVLGGLMRDEYTDGEDRVPGLASIPLVGNLFKNQSRKRIKSNLMVFLRPVVMRDQMASDRLTVDRYDAIRAIQQSQQPEESVLNPVNEAPVAPELPPSMQPARPQPVPPPTPEPQPLPPTDTPPQGQ